MEMKHVNWGLPVPRSIGLVIFSKLPISNLALCRCVSRAWNQLVLDYAEEAANNSYPPNSILFATSEFNYTSHKFQNPKIHCFHIDALSFVASCTLVGPDVECITIHNYCNGLLFIDKGGDDHDCEGVFNPVTHEFFETPTGGEVHYFLFDGFGFNPKTKRYKLFRARSGSELKVLRFGIDNNQWTSVWLPSPISLDSHGVYMDGFVYWIGERNENGCPIYALDVETEVFEVITTLEVGSNFRNGTYLQLLNGTIYAVVKLSEPSEIQLWKMQHKRLWIRDFILPYELHGQPIHPIKASQDGKIFFRTMKDLVCFNKSEKKIERTNKIKTLIPQERQWANLCTSFIGSLHFGSLSNILMGDDE